jgi:predicted O-methyltransferase YrrM
LIFRTRKYLEYIIRGKSIYRLHSPFVFEFAANILKDKRHFYAFDQVEQRRQQLLKRRDRFERTDLGAGSRSRSIQRPSVSEVTRSSAIPARYGRLLFRMVRYFDLKNIIELGSCTGIGSLYLASAMGNGKLVTLEGDPVLALVSRESLDHFAPDGSDATVINEEFDEGLPAVLEELGSVDLAFVDGNHCREATLAYFETLLPYCHEHSILVFDDINWSVDMAGAWKTIRQHPSVRLTIDLHRMGLVFFRKENREVEHFTLYY